MDVVAARCASIGERRSLVAQGAIACGRRLGVAGRRVIEQRSPIVARRRAIGERRLVARSRTTAARGALIRDAKARRPDEDGSIVHGLTTTLARPAAFVVPRPRFPRLASRS